MSQESNKKMVKKKLAQKVKYDQRLSGFESQEELHHQADKEIMSLKIKFFNSFDYMFFYCLTLMVAIYYVSYIQSINWHLSAVGRIIMIQTLPIYDWVHMKNKLCLIERKSDFPIESFLNCDLCETIKKLDVYENIKESILEEKYIGLDLPVIVSNGLNQWPRNSSFLNELLLNFHFSSSFPCKLSSSVIKHLTSTKEIIMKVKKFDEFFLHFQNCEEDAIKALRQYSFRPAMIPATYSPTTYNWLVWNKNYNGSVYKTIELVEKLTIFGQIMGSTHIKLVPRDNCVKMCSTLSFQLFQGEMLVFTSLWDLDYKCNDTGENLALIMEIRN